MVIFQKISRHVIEVLKVMKWLPFNKYKNQIIKQVFYKWAKWARFHCLQTSTTINTNSRLHQSSTSQLKADKPQGELSTALHQYQKSLSWPTKFREFSKRKLRWRKSFRNVLRAWSSKLSKNKLWVTDWWSRSLIWSKTLRRVKKTSRQFPVTWRRTWKAQGRAITSWWLRIPIKI